MPRALHKIVARRLPRGFTLFELVITLVVIGVLAAIAAPLLFGGFGFFRDSTAPLNTVDKLRYATERMARELREVQNNAGTFAIALAANNVTFTKDSGAIVTFNGTAPPLLTMTDSSVGGPFTLTNEVSAVTFAGFEINGTATTDPALVAFVEITLVLGNISQRTRVALRSQL